MPKVTCSTLENPEGVLAERESSSPMEISLGDLCLEHTGVVSQLIREAKKTRGDLAVLWMDLTNAYGSIPHKLVKEALTRHHVPETIRNIILDYYNRFRLRVSSGTVTSARQRLQKRHHYQLHNLGTTLRSSHERDRQISRGGM